jgi:hypothetical protein
MFKRHFSWLRNPRERVTFARRKRRHSDRSFSGRTRRSRWLHFLFLPFPAGNISQGPGSFHFDAAIRSVSVSASGEKSVCTVAIGPFSSFSSYLLFSDNAAKASTKERSRDPQITREEMKERGRSGREPCERSFPR